jgi:hypothetical protein
MAAGAGGAGPGGAGALERARWARMACTARGSWAEAMTRSRPPQQGQARTSRWNTRRIRAAQVHALGVPAARWLASSWRAVDSGAGRALPDLIM